MSYLYNTTVYLQWIFSEDKRNAASLSDTMWQESKISARKQ